MSQVFQASLETLSLRLHAQFPIVVIIKLADFVRSGFVPLRPFKYQPNMVGVLAGIRLTVRPGRGGFSATSRSILKISSNVIAQASTHWTGHQLAAHR